MQMVYILGRIINPRRACARVTVVALCVCVSVCPSVTALAASASAYTCSQRYSGFVLGFSWIYMCGISKKPKVMAWKSQYANELELTISRFRAVSGPTKRSSYVKGNWWVD